MFYDVKVVERVTDGLSDWNLELRTVGLVAVLEMWRLLPECLGSKCEAVAAREYVLMIELLLMHIDWINSELGMIYAKLLSDFGRDTKLPMEWILKIVLAPL